MIVNTNVCARHITPCNKDAKENVKLIADMENELSDFILSQKVLSEDKQTAFNILMELKRNRIRKEIEISQLISRMTLDKICNV